MKRNLAGHLRLFNFWEQRWKNHFNFASLALSPSLLVVGFGERFDLELIYLIGVTYNVYLLLLYRLALKPPLP